MDYRKNVTTIIVFVGAILILASIFLPYLSFEFFSFLVHYNKPRSFWQVFSAYFEESASTPKIELKSVV